MHAAGSVQVTNVGCRAWSTPPSTVVPTTTVMALVCVLPEVTSTSGATIPYGYWIWVVRVTSSSAKYGDVSASVGFRLMLITSWATTPLSRRKSVEAMKLASTITVRGKRRMNGIWYSV